MKKISFEKNDNIYSIVKEYKILSWLRLALVKQKTKYFIIDLNTGLIFTETYKEVEEENILDFVNWFKCRYKDYKDKIKFMLDIATERHWKITIS